MQNLCSELSGIFFFFFNHHLLLVVAVVNIIHVPKILVWPTDSRQQSLLLSFHKVFDCYGAICVLGNLVFTSVSHVL